jgi:hypothetical protein
MNATENPTLATVGTFTVNGKVEYLRVVRNPSGTWTAGGPHAMRDFARRGDAVRWLKRIFSHPSNGVVWNE